MKNKLINALKKEYKKHITKVQYASPNLVEKAEQIFYINYLSQGMTVFDVGANIGEISLLFSRFVGTQGQVHSFEASSSVFNKLNTICTLANRPQIILNHKAVSDKSGIVKLYVYDETHSGWNSLANRPLENYGIDVKPAYTENVEAITLDSYCEENNISYIDLLKIDIEGAEYQALLGARNLLENQNIGCCIFEFGATTFDIGNQPEEIKSYFEKFGYQIENIVKNDPIFPGGTSAKEAHFSIHIAMQKK